MPALCLEAQPGCRALRQEGKDLPSAALCLPPLEQALLALSVPWTPSQNEISKYIGLPSTPMILKHIYQYIRTFAKVPGLYYCVKQCDPVGGLITLKFKVKMSIDNILLHL